MTDLATAAEVKAQLRIDPADTTDDAYLGALITDVSDWIAGYVRRQLAPASGVTLLVDTAAGSTIDVRRWGIRAVTSLGVASGNQPDTGGTYTSVAAADIVLRPPAADRDEDMPATSIVILGAYARLVDAVNGARIVGDTGPAAIPRRVARVAIDAVAAAYTSRKAGGSGTVGADSTAMYPWSAYFAAGSPQRLTLQALRGGPGIG